ncbi:MAG: PilZ domain-containing protein [Terriglobia bacterium]|jgi:ActR/RegA family two-component response regulator|nr:PilZ domain-containing protein [Terriglobia bacterium]
MELTALLLSTDARAHTMLRRVLGNVGIRTEVCTAPAAGLRMLKSKKFEGIIVDCDDIDCGADLLSILRGEGYTKNAIVFAIVHDSTTMSDAFSMGANFVLEKPLNMERAARCFKAACGLMVGERRRYYRHSISVPVYLDFPGYSAVMAQMRDLSQGGAMLSCPADLELDLQGTFRFTLPETRADITGACEVAWKRDQRMGLRFNGMSKSNQAALEMWLNWKFQERFPNAVPALDESPKPVTVQ